MLFSKQTPEAGGEAFAQFDAAWAYDGNGYIYNDTGTSLDVRIGADGSVITLPANGTLPIKLVHSMAELYIRRTDQGTTQVTVEAQVGTGSAVGGGSTADMAVIAAQAAAASTVAHNADAGAHADGLNKIEFTAIAPPDIPIVAVGSAGDLTGAYKWQISAYTAEGDSGFSPLSAQVTLTSSRAVVSLPVHSDERVIGWHIYRSKVGNTSRTFLSGAVLNGVMSYEDNVLDASLGKDSHYLQTTTGYTCQGIEINGVPVWRLQGLNLFMGEQAGEALIAPANQSVTNLYAMAFGSGALQSVTTGGGYLLAIGGGALQNATSAGQVMAIGHKAGRAANYLVGCTFIGHLSGENTTRSNNTFVGGNSGQANVLGADCTCVGKDTATGGFSRVVVLGKGVAATADDQMIASVASAELTGAGGSIVLKSPNGTRYRITVSDAGELAVAAA